jgi:hypothetical protein
MDGIAVMGGTGDKLTHIVTVVAGVASIIATLMSALSIWLQAKNYRKPLQQRYVVRILLMVPIYSISSWTSMMSHTAAAVVDPIRDIYEAFTIYTFFQLLINYLDGERALIIMMHGRAPVNHLWPMDRILPKVDISDPHTFLAIKRGILQYTWLKPVLSLATIIMRACGVYKEGYIGLDSGYLWTGLLYNISVTLSLYSLGLFWVCMHDDLKPFRPVPKFLCVKLIIFASYWQGFLLSLLVWIGAIPDAVEGYTPDNLAAAMQDALICLEMPLFAAYHWHAFSWRDYAKTRMSARMTVGHAFRDAFGPKDLIEDTKMTLRGENYAYRVFDSGDKIIAHEDSRSRLARLKDGMRYENGGKGKYWIRKPGDPAASPVQDFVSPTTGEVDPTMSTPLLGNSSSGPSSRRPEGSSSGEHGTFEETTLDSEVESLYTKARELEYGDWNYPVVSPVETLVQRYGSPRASHGSRSPASPFTQASRTSPVGSSLAPAGAKRQLPPRAAYSSSSGASTPSRPKSASQKPSPPAAASPSPPPDPVQSQSFDGESAVESEQLLRDTRPSAADGDDSTSDDEDDEAAVRRPLYSIGNDDVSENVWCR